MTQFELVERIKAKRIEAEKAGVIHRRDLNREIKRLEKELRIYRHYRREAAKIA